MNRISPFPLVGGQRKNKGRPRPALPPGDWPVISLNEPWASAVFHGGGLRKDIENRTWVLPHKYLWETVLIHATISRTRVLERIRWLNNVWGLSLSAADMRYGQIVGAVRFSHCHYGALDQGWGMANHWWWHIDSAWRFGQPLAARGRQGWWNVRIDRMIEMEKVEDPIE